MGDSCLFQVRDEELVESFPLWDAAQFGNAPVLLGSRSSRPVTRAGATQECCGACYNGDLFFLMTDAVAQWFLKDHEAGRQPWHTIQEEKGQRGLVAWIDELRDEGEIRNDDVTVLVVRIQQE